MLIFYKYWIESNNAWKTLICWFLLFIAGLDIISHATKVGTLLNKSQTSVHKFVDNSTIPNLSTSLFNYFKKFQIFSKLPTNFHSMLCLDTESFQTAWHIIFINPAPFLFLPSALTAFNLQESARKIVLQSCSFLRKSIPHLTRNNCFWLQFRVKEETDSVFAFMLMKREKKERTQ